MNSVLVNGIGFCFWPYFLFFGLQIEFEPEYLMGDFDRNPDIDEKPPMSLGEALEKVKPFLMVYEGIQSQEEWEVKFAAPVLCFFRFYLCAIQS